VDEPPFLNARVYAIADKYFIQGLKVLSKKKFRKSLELRKDSKTISNAVRIVYTSTPDADRGLRSVITDIVKECGNSLLENEDFKTMLTAVPEFALDLLYRVWEERFCQECGRRINRQTDNGDFSFQGWGRQPCISCGY
jgi:hypothetical protein